MIIVVQRGNYVKQGSLQVSNIQLVKYAGVYPVDRYNRLKFHLAGMQSDEARGGVI